MRPIVSATVDLGGIDKLIAAAEAVDSPEQIEREAKASVDMIESLYTLGFERTEAPDGRQWAPPKHDYGHPLMRDTRALQRGAQVIPEPDGVRIVVDVPHAEYHQHGTPKMVDRPIVPEAELGPRWERQIGLARVAEAPVLP
jgi:hypothetical protein